MHLPRLQKASWLARRLPAHGNPIQCLPESIRQSQQSTGAKWLCCSHRYRGGEGVGGNRRRWVGGGTGRGWAGDWDWTWWQQGTTACQQDIISKRSHLMLSFPEIKHFLFPSWKSDLHNGCTAVECVTVCACVCVWGIVGGIVSGMWVVCEWYVCGMCVVVYVAAIVSRHETKSFCDLINYWSFQKRMK